MTIYTPAGVYIAMPALILTINHYTNAPCLITGKENRRLGLPHKDTKEDLTGFAALLLLGYQSKSIISKLLQSAHCG